MSASPQSVRIDLAKVMPVIERSSRLDISDDAVDAVPDMDTERFLRGLAVIIRQQTERVLAMTPVTGQYIDPGDTLVNALEKIYRVVDSKLLRWRKVRPASRSTRAAFDRYIKTVADCAEAARDLRAAIISYDLAAEPAATETFGSAEALIRSLRAQS
jgi:DNA polymerase III delta subunit